MVQTKKQNKPKQHSLKTTIFAYAELMRFGNCVMAAIAVLIGFFLAQGQIYTVAALAALASICVCGAGQAINDYVDASIDKKTSAHRPIPSGRVNPKHALLFAVALFVLGVFIANSINQLTGSVALLFAILLVLYPVFMNKVKYLGNIVVALGTAVTFIFGAAATGYIPSLVLLFATSAFFSNMGREVTKDIEDVKKDTGTKITLPMITPYARYFVVLYYALAFILAISAYTTFALPLAYSIVIIASGLVFLFALAHLWHNNPAKSQRTSKMAMLLSLLAFIFAGFK